jgi:elongation factor P hydroxylase
LQQRDQTSKQRVYEGIAGKCIRITHALVGYKYIKEGRDKEEDFKHEKVEIYINHFEAKTTDNSGLWQKLALAHL